MRLLAIITLPIALALAGCGSSKPQPAASAAATTSSTPVVTRAVKAHKRVAAKAKAKRKAKIKAKANVQVAAKTTGTKANQTTKATTTTTAAKTPAAKPTAPPPGSAVDTGSSRLGSILVGANGRTLYLFKKDLGPTSTCSGACASVWPAYTTNGNPVAGAGVQASLLGTTKRSDGTTQVTYAGHPLYYFAGDTSPGSISGEGLKQFGARWWVVSPAGGAIKRG
jgi:predicted lipoprotein with Yx(FWY)xxD motif